MDALTRWKTIATIAIAFSAGNLFATACQNGGGGKANAEDGTTEDSGDGDGGGTTEDGSGSTPPPDGSRSRAVFSLGAFFGDDGLRGCFSGNVLQDGCECPPGFSMVGAVYEGSFYEAVCLEE